MIFELYNKKIPNNPESYKYSEDVLTGIVFGNLRYFSNQDLLRSFLNEAVSLKNKRPNLISGSDFDIIFWERYSSETDRGEPDLHLRNKLYDIIIECKYWSKLGENIADESPENYTSQLTRYSNVLKDSEKEKFVIYLTNDYVRPNKELEKNQSKLEQQGIGLYWLSWNRLHYCMKQMSDNILPNNEKLLFQNLLSFLEKRDLVTFYNIRIPEVNSCNWHYKKRYCFHSLCFSYSFSWHYRKPYGFHNLNFICKWRYRNGAKRNR